MKHYSLNQSKFLTPQEQIQLKSVLETWSNHRDVLLIETALATGARAQEILNIRTIDLYKQTESIFIRGIKSSNDREIPVNSELFNQLVELSNDNEMLFDISYQRLNQIWLRIRPVNKKFHSLRHTFALNLYKKTKDLRLVQLAMGHRSILNTVIYSSYVYTTEEMRKIL